MVQHRMIPPLVVAFALLAGAPPVLAQGKGAEKSKQGEARGKQAQAKPQDRGKSQEHARPQERGQRGRGHAEQRGARAGGRGHNVADENRRATDRASSGGNGRGHQGRFTRAVSLRDVDPKLRRFAASSRVPERIAAGAVARAVGRGVDDDDIVIRPNGDRLSLLNDDGVVLVELNDDRARNLGGWRVDPWDDAPRAGAPSFCRSGEGHPVFGREWCLDKGFGLGDYRDLRWGRTRDVSDIIFQREVDRGTLARAVLIDVLGDVVFNRLGLHAITLGYTDPLTGVWLGEPTGPQVLRITSGDVPIAEIYDADHDRRADALIVALRPW